ncbi:hypothetical protein GGR56DRAFT_532194 [Xylariaceae sp. FL0804]|nr:hypothetical protein GGR56DRAFT_532194 [Xylariaceae sp. FL0804]
MLIVPFAMAAPAGSTRANSFAVRGLLAARESDAADSSSGQHGPANAIYVIIAVIGAIIVAAAGTFWYLRVKNARRGKYHQPSDPETQDSSAPRSGRRRGTRRGPPTVSENGNNRDSLVDRNTSIRSIMTLPAYRHKPNDGERVLGREGERDGVDVVVERPTDEDLEALRDEEMETMYQIRVARRQAQGERAERRRLRDDARDARARGDLVALEELRAQQRSAANINNAGGGGGGSGNGNGSGNGAVDELREQQNEIRERRRRAVSSVSYADLGVARHDGTRLRANSTESSERVGLLSDAASISLTNSNTNNGNGNPRSASAQSDRRVSDASASLRSPSGLSHYRNRSVSSALSLNDFEDNYNPNNNMNNYSINAPGSGATTPRLGGGGGGGGGFVPSHARAGSSPEIIGEEDVADGDLGRMGLGLGLQHASAAPPPDYDEVQLDEGRHAPMAPFFAHNEPPPDYADGRNLAATAGGASDSRGGQQQRRRFSNGSGSGRSGSSGSGNEGWDVVASGDLSSSSPDEEASGTAAAGDRSPRSGNNNNRSSAGRRLGVGGAPQLPSLRIRELPQIVIEPSPALAAPPPSSEEHTSSFNNGGQRR